MCPENSRCTTMKQREGADAAFRMRFDVRRRLQQDDIVFRAQRGRRTNLRPFAIDPVRDDKYIGIRKAAPIGVAGTRPKERELDEQDQPTGIVGVNVALRRSLTTWFTVWPRVHIPKRFVAPFLRTTALRFVHESYFLISFATLTALCLIDIRPGGFAYALPAIGCFHGAAAIGVLPHVTGRAQIGYRRHGVADTSHNNVLAAIMSLREGWHNNHHAHPGRWWQGETRWEIDPPAFMIRHVFMIDKDREKRSPQPSPTARSV